MVLLLERQRVQLEDDVARAIAVGRHVEGIAVLEERDDEGERLQGLVVLVEVRHEQDVRVDANLRVDVFVHPVVARAMRLDRVIDGLFFDVDDLDRDVVFRRRVRHALQIEQASGDDAVADPGAEVEVRV